MLSRICIFSTSQQNIGYRFILNPELVLPKSSVDCCAKSALSGTVVANQRCTGERIQKYGTHCRSAIVIGKGTSRGMSHHTISLATAIRKRRKTVRLDSMGQ